MGLMKHWLDAIYFTTGNDNHASWGMSIIGGILPGMVDYVFHALNGRLNTRGEASLLRGVKIESAKTMFLILILIKRPYPRE